MRSIASDNRMLFTYLHYTAILTFLFGKEARIIPSINILNNSFDSNHICVTPTVILKGFQIWLCNITELIYFMIMIWSLPIQNEDIACVRPSYIEDFLKVDEIVVKCSLLINVCFH